MKRIISIILAVCMIAAISIVSVSAQKNVVNVVSQTGTVDSTSTVYAGEVVVNGESVIRYLYSDDITAGGSTVLGALMDALNHSELEGFGEMLINYVDGGTGIALCSVDGYAEDMDENWKDAVNVAALYYPDREVGDSMSVDLFGYDDGYTEYCGTYLENVDVVDEAGEPYVTGGVLGAVSFSVTDSVTYTVIDGELVKLIDRDYDYNLEEITVIYTRAELASSTSQVKLGDADGSGEVDEVDATIIRRYVTMIAVPYEVDQLMNADIDGDGDLTIVDAAFIQRYATGVKIPYAIGEIVG